MDEAGHTGRTFAQKYDGTSGTILRWYAYGLGANDVLNQTNVAAGTRSALVPGHPGLRHRNFGLRDGDADEGQLSALWRERQRAKLVRLHRAAHRSRDQRALLFSARHYSPMLGRFLQTDPMGTKGGVNLYAYVRNDPLNRVDPSGLSPDGPQASAAGGTGGGGDAQASPVTMAAGGAGGGLGGGGGAQAPPGGDFEEEEPTIGEILSGFGPDTLIHLTPSAAGSFAAGVNAGTFFAHSVTSHK